MSQFAQEEEFPEASLPRARCRGPFGFAQGRLFDSAGTSLREVSAPLKMTGPMYLAYVERAIAKECTVSLNTLPRCS